MAALTADRNTEYSLGDLLAIPVAGSTRIFAGSFVCVNRAGLAVPGHNGEGLILAGVATSQADNRRGGDGAISAVVRRRGRYLFDFEDGDEPLHQDVLGCRVWVLDDQTVGLWAPDHFVEAGIVDRVEPERRQVWVAIDMAVLKGRD